MIKKSGQILICKADCNNNYDFLCGRGFANFKKSELIRYFEEYIDDYGADEVIVVGHKYDKKRQRHTQFVNLNRFYKYVVYGKL